MVEAHDLGLFVTLDALLQEGSVTGAARRLGLSTPAMSHALARIRERFGDPMLVRAGRRMVLTPRAEALRPAVRDLVSEAGRLLRPDGPFDARSLEQSFVVHATDHVLTVLGVALDRVARAGAPRVTLRFRPNAPDDAAALREGSADLAVGIYGKLPPELRSRRLFTDRLVCVVREGHPGVGKRLTAAEFARLEHVQIAPRGRPGGSEVDHELAARGLERRIARAVPYFLAGLSLVAETDYVLTVSERLARGLGPRLGLRVLEPPLPLKPYALNLLWHSRFDGDEAHRWLREAFVEAARASASDVHPDARTRLAPAPGGRKKRARG
ncbi:MAG TPA: LysR family transcriptional regulator [Polyangiaceae bacterium]|nr:LysR family transcriptional regulator [Polyangiaceae bacterium]